MAVIPPGLDLQCFHRRKKGDSPCQLRPTLGSTVRIQPSRLILGALPGPDQRQGICSLGGAYGGIPQLQQLAIW